MRRLVRTWGTWVAGLAVVALASGLLVDQAGAAAKPKGSYSTPVISCGASGESDIEIQVCAGATGAPSGFSLQWLTKEQLDGFGGVFPPSEDPSLCKGSFSGNANGSRYNLGPNQCVTVDIGDLLFDNGASTNCAAALVCGTEFVFQAFAHGDNVKNRSAFSSTLTCATADCPTNVGCSAGQGFWKNHQGCWDVTSLQLGDTTYDAAQLQTLLSTPGAGNFLLQLQHQLIATKLNLAEAASHGWTNPTDIQDVVDAADALIGSNTSLTSGQVNGATVPSHVPARSFDGALVFQTLVDFNNGDIGEGPCVDENGAPNTEQRMCDDNVIE